METINSIFRAIIINNYNWGRYSMLLFDDASNDLNTNDVRIVL